MDKLADRFSELELVISDKVMQMYWKILVRYKISYE